MSRTPLARTARAAGLLLLAPVAVGAFSPATATAASAAESTVEVVLDPGDEPVPPKTSPNEKAVGGPLTFEWGSWQ
ncbi:hypothetical protein [Actinoplanes sp. G11-F43]|uniref:hypothetical protein n=1 Tax=Actinoplanes sp. G11-F43 TaxID=3424130 RepID=UPI003D358C07